MIGSFLIFLREGIEGSMIIGIMLTYLRGNGRRDLFPWVFAGIAAALAGSAALGVVLYVLFQSAFVGSTAQSWFETATFLVAVVILTSMTFWMKANSRNLGREIKDDMGSALTEKSGMALALVAFVTVGREAVETAIFMLAIAFKSQGVYLLAGALAGLAVALAITIGMYRMGLRLNFKRFFQVMGGLLLLVASGLLANAVANLQVLSVLPGSDQVLWHTGSWLSDQTGVGDVLHGIIGYSDAPTALQATAWLAFLCVSVGIFLELPSKVRMRPVRVKSPSRV